MIMASPLWEISLKLSTDEVLRFTTCDSEDYSKIVFALDDYRRSYNQRKRRLVLKDLKGGEVDVDLDQIEWVSVQSVTQP